MCVTSPHAGIVDDEEGYIRLLAHFLKQSERARHQLECRSIGDNSVGFVACSTVGSITPIHSIGITLGKCGQGPFPESRYRVYGDPVRLAEKVLVPITRFLQGGIKGDLT